VKGALTMTARGYFLCVALAGCAAHAPAKGTPDAGPTQVLACDSLAAVGKWENITPNGTTLPDGYLSQAFVLDPLHAGTLYVGIGHDPGVVKTSAPTLFKTSDCGASWVHINTGKNGALLDAAMLWALAIDPVDPEVLYASSGYGANGVFKSTNGGVDWVQILPMDISSVLMYGGFVERIVIDPTDHLHLIVSPHFACQNGHTNCVVESMDGGASWRILDGMPEGGEDSGQLILDSRTWLWASTTGVWRSGDGGASWQSVWKDWSFPSLYHSRNGNYYLMSAQDGLLESSDSIAWHVVPSSSHGSRAVWGDGTTLFTSARNFNSTPYQPYEAASEASPTKFATYASPAMSQGGWLLAYDDAHHLLYSSNERAGFWRVVTK
jgi:hypothetical protein